MYVCKCSVGGCICVCTCLVQRGGHKEEENPGEGREKKMGPRQEEQRLINKLGVTPCPYLAHH